jgi:hypothetical protein
MRGKKITTVLVVLLQNQWKDLRTNQQIEIQEHDRQL